MVVISILSEALLYLSFSLLLGSFILYLVPKKVRPDLKIPKPILLTATLGVAFLSFVPVLKIILYLYKDLGWGSTIQSVLFQFEVGKSWVRIGIVSVLLFIFLIPVKLDRKPIFALQGLLFTLILIGLTGWASHASSLSKWEGSLTHSTHLLAVCIWVGILAVVSWFAKNSTNWEKFLKWFTPLAIICFVIVAFTGFHLMSFMMREGDYVNSWSLSFGQTLLIKHLAIIPLLVFAFINSILTRNRFKKDPGFNPLPWARLESVFILLIFAITGTLGQQAPPHNIETTIKEEGISPLFQYFHGGEMDFPIQLTPSLPSYALFFCAIICLLFIFFSYIKKAPKFLAFTMGILSIIASYLALMSSI
ncbi:copper resistance D family protein [Neobacillus sp.]|uniref:copper resistance D family protein n=1 Tax=Neobacillus sp. TaxID=2675273 RepID=UPI0035B55A8A